MHRCTNTEPHASAVALHERCCVACGVRACADCRQNLTASMPAFAESNASCSLFCMAQAVRESTVCSVGRLRQRWCQCERGTREETRMTCPGQRMSGFPGRGRRGCEGGPGGQDRRGIYSRQSPQYNAPPPTQTPTQTQTQTPCPSAQCWATVFVSRSAHRMLTCRTLLCARHRITCVPQTSTG
eukprot:2769309-Rhodomonas_salina.1